MGMPSGDTPAKAEAYYHYLQAHHETERTVAEWHIRWLSLAWMWGFLAALALILIWWIWQYRSTRQKTGIYPVESWGGYASELAGPATLFFVLLTALLVAFAVVMIVGHLVDGQIF